jgi:hypothetical protein
MSSISKVYVMAPASSKIELGCQFGTACKLSGNLSFFLSKKSEVVPKRVLDKSFKVK